MHKLHTLKNGLRVLLLPIKDSNSVTILKGYGVGSRNETLDVAGVSHFIEHMMFKGAKKFKTSKAISVALDVLGASYNAYTAKDMTAYYVKVAAPHFKKAGEIFFDMLYHAHFSKAEMEKERGVILEEIKMYEDAPAHYIDNVYEQAAFAGTTLGRDIIGTRETIKGMKHADLVSYMRSYYSDKGSVLVIAGKYPRNILKLLNGWIKKNNWHHTPPIVEKLPAQGLTTSIITKKVEQTQLALGFRTVGYGHHDSHAISILSTMLGGGMSSILFHELREKKGLCYSVSMHPILYEDIGSLVMFAGLNTDKLHEALQVTVDTIKKFLKTGITDKLIADTKSQMVGKYLLALEDNEVLAESYLKRYLLTGEIVTPQERIKRVTKVTKSDILRVAKSIFTKENTTLALITPKHDEKCVAILQQLP